MRMCMHACVHLSFRPSVRACVCVLSSDLQQGCDGVERYVIPVRQDVIGYICSIVGTNEMACGMVSLQPCVLLSQFGIQRRQPSRRHMLVPGVKAV